jgi:integrase
MASIRKKGARYEARVTVLRKTTSKTFATHAQARQWAASTEASLPLPITTSAPLSLAESPQEAAVQSLEQASLQYGREVSCHHKGVRQEIQRISELCRLEFAHKALTEVTADDIKKLRDSELAKGRSGSTIRLKLSLISAIYRHANAEWQLSVDNPVAAVRKPPAGRARQRRLTADELERLTKSTQHCRNPHMKALVLFAIESGMRRSEMLSMSWREVHFDRGVIALADTKNGQPRWIPLTPSAREILMRQQTARTTRPFPITESAVAQAWPHILKRAAIDGLRFHDLRHEALSRWAHRLGGDVFKLSLVSGHRTLSMAQRYVHPVLSELMAASVV